MSARPFAYTLTFHDQQHGARRFVADAVVDDAVEQAGVVLGHVRDGQVRRVVVHERRRRPFVEDEIRPGPTHVLRVQREAVHLTPEPRVVALGRHDAHRSVRDGRFVCNVPTVKTCFHVQTRTIVIAVLSRNRKGTIRGINSFF